MSVRLALYRLAALLLLVSPALAQTVVVNELMASNTATIADDYGVYADWIELHNPGPAAVDLTDWYLSDDPLLLPKWQFPSGSIAPGGYLLVWASDRNLVSPAGQYHANFKLSSAGETVTLTRPDGVTIADQAPAQALGADQSFARMPDGAATWSVLTVATPGTANSPPVPTVPTPSFSQAPGTYAAPIDLGLSVAQTDAVIRYTLDGSEPTATSPVYATPLTLTDRAGDPAVHALIPTNFITTGLYAWRLPRGEITKINVVRARAFADGCLPSDVLTGSFVVGSRLAVNGPYPVVSVVSDPVNLFADDIGIYVPGDAWIGGDTGNYFLDGDAWERPVHIEVFDQAGAVALAQDTGMRISGGMTVTFPQKSLKFYARDEYGDGTFDLQLFPDLPYTSYKRFKLRNAGNDWCHRGFADLASHAAVKCLGVDVQAGRPAIHFLNGEYWGLANLREEYSRFYYEAHYDIADEDVVLLENNGVVDDGPVDAAAPYFAMLDYIDQHDMADPAVYEHVNTLMDVDNFIRYVTAEIYAANVDWPGNNICYWRKNLPSYDPHAQPGHDGRWRWSLFDLDFCWAESGTNTLERALATDGPDWPNPPWSTRLLRGLLRNPTFQRDLVNAFADHMNSTFVPARLQAIFDQYAALYRPAKASWLARWDATDRFEVGLSTMKAFASYRPASQRSHLVTHFGLGGTTTITLNVNDPARGKVRINSLLIDAALPGLANASQPYPWSGVYFRGNEVTVTAVPEPGYVFTGWQGSASTQPSLSFTPGAATTSLTAVFAPDPNPPVVLHAWHFNALPAGTLTGVAADIAAFGAPLITYPGTGAGYLDAVAGTPTGALPGIEAGTGLRVRNPSDTRQLLITLPLDGYDAPRLEMAVWRSTEGPREVLLQYATDQAGVDWHSYGTVIVPTETPVVHAWDFAGVAGVADNPFFRVRLLFQGAQAAGTSGNTRLDNLVVRARGLTGTGTGEPEVPAAVRGLGLAASPNPLNPQTTISLTVPRAGPVSVAVYDVAGRRLRTLHEGAAAAGPLSLGWDGRTDRGAPVASGVYLCRGRAADLDEVVKLQVVK